MFISSIRIKILEKENRLLAVADVTFDGMIAVHGIKIIQGREEKFFLAMPSKENKMKKFEDIVHPVNADARTSIERMVFRAYEFCVEQSLRRVQLDIAEDNCPNSLMDQVFEDFQMLKRE